MYEFPFLDTIARQCRTKARHNKHVRQIHIMCQTNVLRMPDEKVKVSIRIPNSTLESVRQIGYTSTTEAILEGLELLIKTKECQTTPDECRTVPDNSQTVPDSAINSDFQELRARLEEKDILINTLQKELDKAGQREDDLKETHRNYMLQMQTLINQKAIEAPGAKKPWWQFW